MGAGALRHSVTIDRQAASGDDGYGNPQTGWEVRFGPAPARIRPMRAREVVGAEGVTGRALVEISIRYHALGLEIAVGDRIRASTGAVYNVKSPAQNNDEHRRYLTILAEAGGGDG